MAVRKRRAFFRLVRFKNFLVVLLKNRMALVGLFLITLFSGMALFAPYITPYDPQGTVVAGNLSPPSWIVYFTGDVGWSRNAIFQNPVASGAPGAFTSASTGTSSVDLHISSQTSSGGTIKVVETLSYPYRGPPKQFIGNVELNVASLTGAGLQASAYVERVGVAGAHWTLWRGTVNGTGIVKPPAPFDSTTSYVSNTLGFTSGAIFNAAELLFSQKTDYTYTLELVLPTAPVKADISVKNFSMFLYGNSWGLLGTDDAGRDIFTQLVHGARWSLLVGITATIIGVGLGLLVGLMAGYLGKMVDEVLMRFTDMMLVIPGLPLLIVLIAVIGPSLTSIIIVLGFLGWMGFARLVRSQVLSLRERPFIEAAKASGAGTGYILTKHVFPNIVSLTYVNLALSVPAAIVGEAALSFLGLGDESIITWGKMLELGRDAGSTSSLLWWWIIPPGVAIAAISLSFILLGYAMDELFNPRLRRRR